MGRVQQVATSAEERVADVVGGRGGDPEMNGREGGQVGRWAPRCPDAVVQLQHSPSGGSFYC